MNHLKTGMLLATLTALILWIGQSMGGREGIVIALIVAGAMNFISYWWSDKIALRMHRAEEVTENQAPKLHQIVANLAQKAGIPMPRIYMSPTESPNAFATGRNPQHAAVCVTAGLMNVLDHDEIEGVIAHELGHVQHRDTLIMTVAATLAGALSMLTRFGMFGGGYSSSDGRRRGGNPLLSLIAIIVAPLAASLIQMAISRSREFLADEAAARFSGKPLALASALRKISSWSQRVPMEFGSPATAHLFILNPFSARGLASLFSTHPSTEERIARLEAMAPKGRVAHV
jgi:heat shock protein HtpX